MKLLTKSTLYIATLSLFLFFFMGIIFYHILKNMSLAEMNREMQGTRDMVLDVFPHFLGGQLGGFPGIDSLSIALAGNPGPGVDHFGDTLMFDPSSSQFRNFRSLTFRTSHGGSEYEVVLYKSTTPTDKLVEKVTLLMTLMVLLFLAGFL
ncbi:MAG: hypothetical protein R2751_20160 [Bacteroidales bacterium]